MKEKKNDYIVVRRINMREEPDNWEEFESTVRVFINAGYKLVGGVSMHVHANPYFVSVAQTLIKE